MPLADLNYFVPKLVDEPVSFRAYRLSRVTVVCRNGEGLSEVDRFRLRIVLTDIVKFCKDIALYDLVQKILPTQDLCVAFNAYKKAVHMILRVLSN
jgi:hypothetical protein